MEENDTILCTVERVTNTVTFVRLPDGREGTIISSEIAPGRIKFMRQYVFPNKRIVCKVLKDTGEQVHLSLRRVNAKERNEVMQKAKQEQALTFALKQVMGEEAEDIKQQILTSYDSLTTFINLTKDDEELIKKFIPKEKREQFKKVTDKKRKSQILKKMVHLKCLEEDGIKKIKDLFNLNIPELEVSYLAAGEFVLKLTVEDFKNGKKKMLELEEELMNKAKKNHCELTLTEKHD